MDPEAHRDHDRPNSPWTGSGRRSIWVGRARLHPLLLEATVGDDQPNRRLLDRDRVGGPICDGETTELDRLLRSDLSFRRSALRHGNVNPVVAQETAQYSAPRASKESPQPDQLRVGSIF